MIRRRIPWFLALAAIAVLAGGAIGAGAMAGGATRGRVIAAPGATVRTAPYARAMPSTCFITGQTCSIHPCVEYVAPRARRLLRARIPCAADPSRRGLAVSIGQ